MTDHLDPQYPPNESSTRAGQPPWSAQQSGSTTGQNPGSQTSYGGAQSSLEYRAPIPAYAPEDADFSGSAPVDAPRTVNPPLRSTPAPEPVAPARPEDPPTLTRAALRASQAEVPARTTTSTRSASRSSGRSNSRPPVVPNLKSPVLAGVLGLLLGPIGLFYATVPGAVVMLALTAVLMAISIEVGAMLSLPACAIWAVIAVSDHNVKMRRRAEKRRS